MEKVIMLLCLSFICQESFSQDIEECQRIVNTAIEAINDQSSEKLEEYLAADFSIAGQKGEVAKLVLQQLLVQLDDPVNSSTEVGREKLDGGLELKYHIEYKTKGMKEATFTFNEDNLLSEMSLFKMEVKKVCEANVVEKDSKDVIHIPFELAGHLIAVDVLLNGNKRKFILDTGSPRTILNSAYIPKDENKSSISSAQGVGGGIKGMDVEKVASLDFHGIKLLDQEIISIDLAHLEEELGYAFYGLIGFDMIKDYDVLFDYKESTLTFIPSETFSTYKEKNLMGNRLETIDFELEGHIPVIKVEIDNKILHFGIDSGAESNLIDDDLFLQLKKTMSKIKTDELLGADKHAKEVKEGNIKRMMIGDKIFKKQLTAFSDISHLNKGYNLKIDGLIGYPVLSKQKVLISFAREELIFIE